MKRLLLGVGVILVLVLLLSAVSIGLRSVERPEWKRVEHVGFSSDGKSLVTFVTTLRGSIYDLEVENALVIWDLDKMRRATVCPITRDPTTGNPTTGDPTYFALASRGELFAYGAFDTVMLVDTSRSAVTTTLPGHKHRVTDASFAADGSMVATAGNDGAVLIWSLPNGNELTRIEHEGAIMSVDFSADSKSIAFGSSDGSVTLVTDVLGNPKRQVLQDPTAGPANGKSVLVAFSHLQPKLAAVSWEGEMKVWDIESHVARTSEYHPLRRITSIAYSPVQNIIAIGSVEASVAVWDIDRDEITTLRHPVAVNSVAFSPDGKTLATGEGGTWYHEGAKGVRLWNLTTREAETVLIP